MKTTALSHAIDATYTKACAQLANPSAMSNADLCVATGYKDLGESAYALLAKRGKAGVEAMVAMCDNMLAADIADGSYAIEKDDRAKYDKARKVGGPLPSIRYCPSSIKQKSANVAFKDTAYKIVRTGGKTDPHYSLADRVPTVAKEKTDITASEAIARVRMLLQFDDASNTALIAHVESLVQSLAPAAAKRPSKLKKAA